MPPVALDSSVILAWILDDEGLRDQAVAVRTDIELGRLTPVGAAPLSFELRNGLVKGARRGRLAWDAIPHELAAFDRWRVRVEPPPEEEQLLGLCRDLGLGWADAHWAELAIRLQLPLVTADQRLVRTLARAPIWVEWLGDRPTG